MEGLDPSLGSIPKPREQAVIPKTGNIVVGPQRVVIPMHPGIVVLLRIELDRRERENIVQALSSVLVSRNRPQVIVLQMTFCKSMSSMICIVLEVVKSAVGQRFDANK